MRVMRGFVATAAVLLLAITVASAEEPLTKQDAQGPVTVEVALLAPPAAGAPLRLKVGFNTHSVALDGIAFDRAVVLRGPDGAEIRATAVEATGGGHHRGAVLTFPAPPPGAPVRVVVKGVGGVAERLFTWAAPAAR